MDEATLACRDHELCVQSPASSGRKSALIGPKSHEMDGRKGNDAPWTERRGELDANGRSNLPSLALPSRRYSESARWVYSRTAV